MGPGDTAIIRFREDIQGPRDQKIALSQAYGEIFLGRVMVAVVLCLNPRQRAPTSAAGLCLSPSAS